ncbi:S9 family peptidase [Deinococcus sp. KNUC1210]|uniref:S9 family peptidase n=1 Tax=Deinococcus sp. KNUC1210 TaxID=2917691 RepID=UPI001EF0AF6A|nr:S9 family peptidase [Deinococcus sp. KNUC1210]ULH15638.1 S9 family peptidase [Deinococcus sp. KNUC1210]
MPDSFEGLASDRPVSTSASTSVVMPESLYALKFPSDPQLSPDGSRVAFVLTRIEDEHADTPGSDEGSAPRYRSRIQLSEGGPARDLTSGESRDSSPRWSPDGTSLAFLSNRSSGTGSAGKPQVYLLPLNGGEARQLTRFRNGVSNLAFSPDGRYLSFLSQGDTEDKRDERGEARAITSLRYRFNGVGMLPPRPAALYLHDLSSGETRLWHAPEYDISDYAWRPQAGGVLFVSSLSQLDAACWRQEVFELPLEGEPRQLTRWAAPIGQLAPHPDGVRFAGIGRPASRLNTEDNHVFLFGASGEGQRLDAAWDFPAGSIVAGDLHVGSFPDRPTWADEQTLSLLYTVGGSAGLFDLQLGGTVSPRLHDPERVTAAFSLNAHGLACISESVTQPTEVYLNGVCVTDHAAQLPFVPVPATRVAFDTELGEGEGWVLLPTGTQTVPALLNIHGGPHTAYGHGFMHEFQLYAAAGYSVCYSNPRGSVGYGQAWSEDIHGRWGSIDMQDLLTFFDACLTQFPRLDATRTGIMGGSYGGFMTNWITSQTDRFQVAVTDRSICNLLSFGGTSDIGMRFWDDELGGNFHRRADTARLWEMSPLQFVEQVRTPTLIIHSLEDLRCPVEQGEQWFTALQLHGVPSRFVRFPGEDHELSRSGRPDRRVRRLQEYLDWVGAYLK